jgi:hypothetical protein
MKDNFLFHKVDEKEKKEIEKQAKKIMDDFSKKLSAIDLKSEELLIEREESVRDELDGKCNEIDRNIFFENASSTLKGTSKNKDFIVAEKKKW